MTDEQFRPVADEQLRMIISGWDADSIWRRMAEELVQRRVKDAAVIEAGAKIPRPSVHKTANIHAHRCNWMSLDHTICDKNQRCRILYPAAQPTPDAPESRSCDGTESGTAK